MSSVQLSALPLSLYIWWSVQLSALPLCVVSSVQLSALPLSLYIGWSVQLSALPLCVVSSGKIRVVHAVTVCWGVEALYADACSASHPSLFTPPPPPVLI